MHVEPLEKLPRSVREFLSHYAMIVLSILTALALEQALVRLEHHHQGERARQEIEQEIDNNRRHVEESLGETRANSDLWDGLLTHTVADFRAGTATSESLLATLDTARHNFRDSTPALTTAAWDAAIANHAVDYLEHDELRRFSELYASQRNFTQTLGHIVEESAMRSIGDIALPGLLGHADPAATIALLNSRRLALHVMASNLSQMDDAMRKTLQMPATAAAPTPAPASATSAAASR